MNSKKVYNCEFTNRVQRYYKFQYSVCIESETYEDEDGGTQTRCVKSEKRTAVEKYTVYTAKFEHKGVERVGCACQSNWARDENRNKASY